MCHHFMVGYLNIYILYMEAILHIMNTLAHNNLHSRKVVWPHITNIGEPKHVFNKRSVVHYHWCYVCSLLWVVDE